MAEPTDRLLKWFAYDHLKPELQSVSLPFHHAAFALCEMCEPGPERTFALRKLLEANYAAIRAATHPGG